MQMERENLSRHVSLKRRVPHLKPTMLGSLLGLLVFGAPAAGLTGCDGSITDKPGAEVPADGLSDAPRFARLTEDQWRGTIRDLLRLEEAPTISTDLASDPPLGRFDNNIARLTLSASHWRSFQRAAEEIGELAISDEVIGNITPADLPDDLEAAGRAFIDSFAHRAYRRPLTSDEKDNYLAVFLEGASHYPESSERDAGIRLVVETLLQSPHFLYRVEESAGPGKVVELSDYEVASRLSYALWNTMPSDELFAAADAGELRSADGVRDWALEMLEDQRTLRQFDSFHSQAFSMREYGDIDKSQELFPDFSRETGLDMQKEAQLFLQGEVFGGGGIRELLTSTSAFVNADMAELYGIEGDFSDQFVQVDLDPEQRAGMLTRLGFLTHNATLTQSDPIHRGVFINLNLICRELYAPPVLPDDLTPVGDTNRERINSITGEGTCGENCHATLINPIGFALENYDAVGQFRAEESGFPVNAADAYTFEDGRTIEFNNALELSQQLAEAPEVHSCYIQQLLEFMLGRDLQQQDMRLVQKFAQQSLEEGISIREIILRVVESPEFRFRANLGGGQ